LVLLCAALVVALWTARADAGFVFVKNVKNPTPKQSKAAIKGVFSGRTKTWSNGETIILVIGSEDAPAMTWIAETHFGISAKTYLSKIKQDVFKGDVPRPLSADDDAKTVKRVQSGPGVVGIVSDAAVGSLPSDVVVLAVE